MKTIGKFEKKFSTFKEGLAALRQVSFSASQALGDAVTEEQAVARLATNVIYDRPTGNGVDWDRCSVSITAYGVDYTTTGGLSFGWRVKHQDFQWNREGSDGNEWRFYVIHPLGENIPENSSLRSAAAEQGWMEVFSDGMERRFAQGAVAD